MKRKTSSSAVILNKEGQILLVKQSQSGRGWELPGGHVRKKEGTVAALIREVEEETGLKIKPQKLLGVFHIPKERFTDFVFLAGYTSGRRPKPGTSEITACNFFAPDDLPKPMRPFVRRRIADALTGRVQSLPQVLKPSQWLS